MNYAEIKKLDEDTLGKLKEGTGPADECLCSLLSPPTDNEDKKSIRSSIKKVFGKVKTAECGKRADGSPDAKQLLPPMDRSNTTGVVAAPWGWEKGSDEEWDEGEGIEYTHRTKPNSLEGRGGIGGGGRVRSAKERKTRIVGQGQVIDIPIAIGPAPAGNVKNKKEVIKHKGSCGKCGCDKEDITLQHSYANIRITSPDISTFCPCPSHECLPEKDREKLKNNIKVTIERMTIDPDSENSETSIHKQRTILEPPLYKKSVSSLINAQYETEEDNLI